MGDSPSPSARLRARLNDLGWAQAEFAAAIGVSPPVVSRWLSGERVPSLEMAFRIQNSAVGIPAEVWIETDAPASDATESGEHTAVDTPRSNTA